MTKKPDPLTDMLEKLARAATRGVLEEVSPAIAISNALDTLRLALVRAPPDVRRQILESIAATCAPFVEKRPRVIARTVVVDGAKK